MRGDHENGGGRGKHGGLQGRGRRWFIWIGDILGNLDGIDLWVYGSAFEGRLFSTGHTRRKQWRVSFGNSIREAAWF